MANDYYRYDPSLPAAIIFAVCFSLSAAGHAYQLVKARTWYFMPFFIGCLVEVVGYIGRAIGATETPNWTKGPYIIQALLLLLGPPFYAASIYMVFGRLVKLLDAEKHSLIPCRWLTKLFLFGDVASSFGQAIGGGKLAGAETQKDRDQGQIIIIVGLGIQIAFFGFFMAVTMLFHHRINRKPTSASLNIHTPWRQLLQVLYGTSFLIMVRSVFRVIEYVLGEDGELQSKEVYIYIFDALLMLALLWSGTFDKETNLGGTQKKSRHIRLFNGHTSDMHMISEPSEPSATELWLCMLIDGSPPNKPSSPYLRTLQKPGWQSGIVAQD
ncbi:rta1 domain-containing protein [Colletotrichum karsti]|uniref:Rta1 domain-containing protein n=1 Tax=Colletotrichum karsti TaxID=1095194 RepID=A0A9P6IIX1_9PEZI|nr:rta1 domain-containing protein [Colletotrichum karsti]KAF9880555.1 rta1 domain-containing protein [Colletotrichum karsti]